MNKIVLSSFLLLVRMTSASSAEVVSQSLCDLELSHPELKLNFQEYVRFPDQKISNPNVFLTLSQNIARSVETILAPAVENGSALSHYEQMLRSQQALIVGDDYQGHLFSQDRSGYREDMSRNAHAGKFVNELGRDPDQAIAKLDLLHLADIPFLSQNYQKYFNRSDEYRISIEWMPESVLPFNKRSTSGSAVFGHAYPKVKDLPMYLYRMKELFGRVLSTSHSDQALDALSDYYHVFSNAHPFSVGNNSLAMSQVNYFLKLNGYSPVSHGDLDIRAISMPFHEFRSVFRSSVEQQQIAPHRAP